MNQKLNEKSIVPLYYQLAEILRENIEDGIWEPDTEIPSENTICKDFEVSRSTVRRAMQELEKEDLIYKKQGKGTFVKRKKFDKDLLGELSFFKEMKSQGLEATSEIIETDIIYPTAYIQSTMNLEKIQKIIKIRRLRKVEGDPFAIETTYLDYERYGSILQRDLDTLVLYEVLEKEFGLDIKEITAYIEPIILNEFFSQYLGRPQGAPALLMERIIKCKKGSGIFSRIIIAGDKAKFYVTTK
ncbi:GntR family transcriptional regulator [Irregularibacter muris]|uniref:GntR family transcriptional regulator n=1 Tax=Irregularibacter muris TaxID=1796619 RepID=A0AAE3HIS1_9FIRM|nr:GntR family transcriptional regulator [Irregularibacter muris]MCR1899408.1 GntR family transcriptional regulator [Irregularibacter muris]